MPIVLIVILVILAIILLIALLVWGTYNSIIKLSERVNEAWSDITVQLKYRADLIPNLVETVKGYAKHEKSTFEEITKARTAVMSAHGVKDTAAAEQSLETAISKVFAIAEAYPDLKSNTNFLQLQQQLQDVEDKIQSARRFYNAGTKALNTKLKLFPTNIINKIFCHFKPRDYYEVAESERAKIQEVPNVKFD